MAFPAGSNSPYVTDLGQDKGAKHPPDFILRVKAGQNYGFPACNHTKAKRVQGFATPFGSFRPHTDLMGIGLHRGRLYLTSFQGRNAKGPGGEVFTLSLKGGALKPLITGFVAPTVGLESTAATCTSASSPARSSASSDRRLTELLVSGFRVKGEGSRRVRHRSGRDPSPVRGR